MSDPVSDPISGVFAALADATRRQLYEQLLESPSGRTATELASAAVVSRQAIVKHLQILVNSGLASPRRDGREVHYVVAARGTSDASTWLLQRSREWDRRTAKLERTVRASIEHRQS